MGVELPLPVVVTILECCVTFSGVKLSIRSFVLFLLPLLFRQMVQKHYSFFLGHIAISQPILASYAQHYELKFSMHTKFDTLISNLNSYVQYKIVMTS